MSFEILLGELIWTLLQWQVSLPALDKACLTNFPLKALTEECASQFGYDAEDHMTDTIGSYFAIAYVSSSHEVITLISIIHLIIITREI